MKNVNTDIKTEKVKLQQLDDLKKLQGMVVASNRSSLSQLYKSHDNAKRFFSAVGEKMGATRNENKKDENQNKKPFPPGPGKR